jgi:anthranilate phosphoribosyltransferase
MLGFSKDQSFYYNMPFLPFLHQIMRGDSLFAEQAESAMMLILEGGATTAQIAAFLVALEMKGVEAEEVLGFARAMRAKSVAVEVASSGEPLLDTCGTGGDGQSTFNISTLAAFVVAGAGVRVAKHGNRSISSKCGSADLLETLGIRVAIPPEAMARAIEEVGIGFLFAPQLHPAMKYAQPARIELKTRTVFNILGPLTNPAGANCQLVGAFSVEAGELMARTLAALELRRACVVMGSDGLDEITTTGRTMAFEVVDGQVQRRELTPEDFGVERAALHALRGGLKEENCEIARRILEGAAGPHRDIVLVNAAAGLVVAGAAANYLEGMELARTSIDAGRAAQKVAELSRFTSGID